MERAKLAQLALERIVAASQNLAVSATEVSESTELVQGIMTDAAKSAQQTNREMSAVTGLTLEVRNAIEEVAAISQESAAGAQELTATIEEVAASASDLARMSDGLKDLVSTFKIEESKSSDYGHLRLAA